MSNNKLKYILPLSILAFMVFVVFLFIIFFPKREVEPLKQQNYLVSAIPADIGIISPTLPIFGYVESNKTSKMVSAVGGDVLSVLTSEGDIVESGQLLVKLDDFDLQLALQQKQADMLDIEAQIKSESIKYKSDKESLLHEQSLLTISKSKLKRAENLFKRKVGSESALDDARRVVEQQSLSITAKQFTVENHQNRMSQLKARKIMAEVALAKARRDLERSEIKAPFSGRIASVAVAEGDRVSPGTPVLTVYDTESFEVRSQIPSNYISKIRKLLDRGDNIYAVGMLDGNMINLKLDRLSGEADRGNAGIAGLFKVTSGGDALVIGRFMNIQMTLPAEMGVFAVPFKAMVGAENIYLIKDGKMKLVAVQRVGEVTDEKGVTRLLLRSDEIKKGDKIITAQVPNAVTGLPVQVHGEADQSAEEKSRGEAAQ